MNSRESRLAEVEQALQAFQWHRGLDMDAVGAVSSLAGLRDASLEVVRAVVVSDRKPSERRYRHILLCFTVAIEACQ